MNKIKKTFKALRRWLFRTPAGFMLIGLTFWLFLFSLFAYSQGLYTWAVGEVKAAEINKGKVNVTLGIMSEEVVSKDEEIKTLEERFQELMDNPITFKQTYFLEHSIFPVTRACGVPDSLAAAQWALESGRATTSPINNFFGIGPGWKFATVKANVEKYCQTIKNILKRKGYDLSQMSDPVEILKALQAGSYRYEGHNPDPMTYVHHISSLKEFKAYQ